jgi:hypothetical protein
VVLRDMLTLATMSTGAVDGRSLKPPPLVHVSSSVKLRFEKACWAR